MSRHAAVLIGLVLACRPSGAAESPERYVNAEGKIVLVGKVQREDVERIPGWSSAGAVFDADAAKRLASVAPGATVTVWFGTWCGDSRRAVPRMFAAFDAAGALPFAVELVAVDEQKTAPPEVALRYVPTIIVVREGREVGRIVETAPEGVEVELLHLLDGSKTGVVTGRTDIVGSP